MEQPLACGRSSLCFATSPAGPVGVTYHGIPLILSLTSHSHRRGAVFRRSVSEFAVVTAAPAIRDPNRRDAAAVVVRAAELREHEPPGHGHRRRAVDPRTVTELRVGVLAPAIGCARGRQGAGVRIAGTYRLDRRDPGDEQRREAAVIGGDRVCLAGAGLCRCCAELRSAIRAPAKDPSRYLKCFRHVLRPICCVQSAQLDLEIFFVPSKECQCAGHILLGINLVSRIPLKKL